MSWLSKFTGIGISPKGVKIDPKKALMTALTFAPGVGLLSQAGKLGTLGKLGVVKKVAGAAKGLVSGDPSQGGRFRDLADLGKFGEGVYDRYQQNRQYGDARKEYANAAPLRDAAMKGLLDTSRPDVSGIFADPMNPQGRYRSVGVGSRGRY